MAKYAALRLVDAALRAVAYFLTLQTPPVILELQSSGLMATFRRLPMQRLLSAALLIFLVPLSHSSAQTSLYAGHYQFYEIAPMRHDPGNPSLMGHFYVSLSGQITGRAIASTFRWYSFAGTLSDDGAATVDLNRFKGRLPDTRNVPQLWFSIQNGLVSGQSNLGYGTVQGSIIYSDRNVPCTGVYHDNRNVGFGDSRVIELRPTSMAIMMIPGGRLIGFAAHGAFEALNAYPKGSVVYLGDSRRKGSQVDFRLRKPVRHPDSSPSGRFFGHQTSGGLFRLTHDPKGESAPLRFTLHPIQLPAP